MANEDPASTSSPRKNGRFQVEAAVNVIRIIPADEPHGLSLPHQKKPDYNLQADSFRWNSYPSYN